MRVTHCLWHAIKGFHKRESDKYSWLVQQYYYLTVRHMKWFFCEKWENYSANKSDKKEIMKSNNSNFSGAKENEEIRAMHLEKRLSSRVKGHFASGWCREKCIGARRGMTQSAATLLNRDLPSWWCVESWEQTRLDWYQPLDSALLLYWAWSHGHE